MRVADRERVKQRTVAVWLGIIVLIVLIAWIWGRAGQSERADLAGIIRTGKVPGALQESSIQGSFREDDYSVPGFKVFQVFRLPPDPSPVAIAAFFSEPVEGRDRAMSMLGFHGDQKETDEAMGRIGYLAGPFVEFSLFREGFTGDWWRGCWAGTPAAVAASDRDIGFDPSAEPWSSDPEHLPPGLPSSAK